MATYLLVIAAALTLSACTMSLREAPEPAPVIIDPPSVYTREQIDAINAEAECKRAARNMVQIARCDTRR